jgi:hypothetical protein
MLAHEGFEYEDENDENGLGLLMLQVKNIKRLLRSHSATPREMTAEGHYNDDVAQFLDEHGSWQAGMVESRKLRKKPKKSMGG